MPWWVRHGARTRLALTSAKMVRFMDDARGEIASRTKSSGLTCIGPTSVGSRQASKARRPGVFSGTRRHTRGEGEAQASLPRRGKDQQESPAYESLVGIDRRAGIRGKNGTRPPGLHKAPEEDIIDIVPEALGLRREACAKRHHSMIRVHWNFQNPSERAAPWMISIPRRRICS